jgi:hypothetical protein
MGTTMFEAALAPPVALGLFEPETLLDVPEEVGREGVVDEVNTESVAAEA